MALEDDDEAAEPHSSTVDRTSDGDPSTQSGGPVGGITARALLEVGGTFAGGVTVLTGLSSAGAYSPSRALLAVACLFLVLVVDLVTARFLHAFFLRTMSENVHDDQRAHSMASRFAGIVGRASPVVLAAILVLPATLGIVAVATDAPDDGGSPPTTRGSTTTTESASLPTSTTTTSSPPTTLRPCDLSAISIAGSRMEEVRRELAFVNIGGERCPADVAMDRVVGGNGVITIDRFEIGRAGEMYLIDGADLRGVAGRPPGDIGRAGRILEDPSPRVSVLLPAGVALMALPAVVEALARGAAFPTNTFLCGPKGDIVLLVDTESGQRVLGIGVRVLQDGSRYVLLDAAMTRRWIEGGATSRGDAGFVRELGDQPTLPLDSGQESVVTADEVAAACRT